jgi:hypothetical protein
MMAMEREVKLAMSGSSGLCVSRKGAGLGRACSSMMCLEDPDPSDA